MLSQKIACEMCALNSSWGNDEGSFKWDASSILFWKAMENFRGKLCLEFSYGESGLSPRTLCTGACTLGLWRTSDAARRCRSQLRTCTTIQLELGSGSGGSCKNSQEAELLLTLGARKWSQRMKPVFCLRAFWGQVAKSSHLQSITGFKVQALQKPDNYCHCWETTQVL